MIKMNRSNLINLLIIVTIVSIGMLGMNQTFAWYYKIQLLAKPCDLCLKLNPNLTLAEKPLYIISNFTGLEFKK